MLLSNKYSRIYYSIINSSRDRCLSGYTERHHIVPKSMGGSNDPSNIAVLSCREHFICHMLLPKFTVGKDRRKMIKAKWLMCNKVGRNSTDYHVSSHHYDKARKDWVLAFTEDRKGFKHSEKTKAKIAASVSGEKNGRYGKKTAKAKPNRAKQSSPEHRQKLAAAKLGKPRSEEAKQKIREGWARRKVPTKSQVEALSA